MDIRRLFIFLIAAAFVFNGAASFVFNGAASRAWIDLPVALAATAQDHHGASVAAGHDAHSGQFGANAIAAAPDQSQDHEHVDSCLKCCNMCNVANVLPGFVAKPVTFSYAAVAFRMGQRNLVGHLVALDPDIPKAII